LKVDCEWGLQAAKRITVGADVAVVVDVLSFSTAIDIAVSRGARVFPYARRDEGLAAFARSVDAEPAGRRGGGQYSLSPACYLEIRPGTRVVLPSVNGGAITRAVASARVLAGCLRNAGAVARAIGEVDRVVVLPAGELWPDGSLRPAIEDWLGAGAIIHHLQGDFSSEAAAASATFEALRDRLEPILRESVSGRELLSLGFAEDISLGSELGASVAAPELVEGAFAPAAV
jgi:2-phosphosulfolactate phosphatase